MLARASWIESGVRPSSARHPRWEPSSESRRRPETGQEARDQLYSGLRMDFYLQGRFEQRACTHSTRDPAVQKGEHGPRTAHLVVQRRGAVVAADTNGPSTRAGCTLDEERARAGVRERAKQGASVRTCFSQASRTSRASQRPDTRAGKMGRPQRPGPEGKQTTAANRRPAPQAAASK